MFRTSSQGLISKGISNNRLKMSVMSENIAFKGQRRFPLGDEADEVDGVDEADEAGEAGGAGIWEPCKCFLL